MRIGCTFPQVDIGSDPVAIRDFAQAVEGAGFDYLIAYDHVLGASPERFDGPVGGFPSAPYTAEHQFHEVFTLFSYLAAVTEHLVFVTSVLILPQRPTALVAKQAAEVDILSGGRLRLAVGVGWNFAEYEGLGADFHTRGRRIEEQIDVLRRLWTAPLVSFEGRGHHLDRVGINPLPVQRPIPIWIGSGPSDVSLRRVARLADGWMPLLQPGEDRAEAIGRLQRYLRENGRDPDSIQIESRMPVDRGDRDDWRKRAEELRTLGITDLTLSAGRGSPVARQLELLLRGREALAEAVG